MEIGAVDASPAMVFILTADSCDGIVGRHFFLGTECRQTMRAVKTKTCIREIEIGHS
jgi:hypothetical protein